MTEYGDVIDEKDKVLRVAERKDIEDNALLHRSASVVVKNSKGEILVHKRDSSRRLYPGLLDIKFGGMAQSGEGFEETALRELEEESGIKGVELKFLFSYRFNGDNNNVSARVYLCTYNSPYKIDNSEVEWAKFMSIDEIKKTENELSPTAKLVFQRITKK
ncbi:MAG: NUDIX domain-containing protein [Nanoarchaeota archaeon]